MKTLQHRKKLPKLVTLISMGLASVPVESFKHNYSPLMSHSQHILSSPTSNTLVAIPIHDATERMNKLADLLTNDLNKLKEEWENTHYSFITEQTYKQINKNIKDIDSSLADIKIVLASFSKNEIKKRESAISFGRALAVYRSALTDVMSFIEQTDQPLKTTSKKLNITEADMRKLIRAEHIKLGLNEPRFDKI